jgi:stearoyl-CoA desaturase (delta-9 desaturase)
VRPHDGTVTTPLVLSHVMWVILGFFVAHWVLCVFFQSFFQHRYAAHRMYRMGPRMEKAVHLATFLVQGSSYLSPRAYAWLHREHHAFSDTDRDPHTPHRFRDVFSMMWNTKTRYEGFVKRTILPEQRFQTGYPEWKLVDETLAQSRVVTLMFVASYIAVYAVFATSWWLWLLLPVHFVMGPVHGAIVNWCGHKYGYRNFKTSDRSRNTLPVDVLCMGELFQNNHHTFGMSPDFAARKFEIDPTWQVMRVLSALKLIKIATPQRAVWPAPHQLPAADQVAA